MALPWLESLPVWGTQAAAAAGPKRFAALFMGNGINPKHWWAKGAGAEMELSKSLEPLAPLQGQAQRHQRPVQQARHRRRHPPRADRQHPLRRRRSRRGPSCSGGISMDQVLANHIGEETVAAEHGAGLRAADHRLPRDELLDGLQLAHLLAERRPRRCRWRSIRRWRSTACSRTAAAGAT